MGGKKSSSLGQAFLIFKAFEKVGVVLFPGPMFRALHFLTTKNMGGYQTQRDFMGIFIPSPLRTFSILK